MGSYFGFIGCGLLAIKISAHHTLVAYPAYCWGKKRKMDSAGNAPWFIDGKLNIKALANWVVSPRLVWTT